MDAVNLFFWLFALTSCGSAMVVAVSPRLFHSVFALFFCFFGVAGLYAILGADFLAAVQVIVYIGGILVLLIFGVMVTNRHSQHHLPNPFSPGRFPGVAPWKLSTVLCGLTLILILTTPAWWKAMGRPVMRRDTGATAIQVTPAKGQTGLREVVPHVGNTTGTVGVHLLTTYVIAFELASIVLLVAMLGAASIARKEVA